MSLIAIIPARGNSKRLPNKNLLPCNGIPLAVRAIRVAKESGLFGERIFVSSEDERILDMAMKEDAHPFSRDPILSGDDIPTASVVFDVLARIHYSCESFCVLNPTTPTRTTTNLQVMWDHFVVRGDVDCMMSMDSTESGGLKHDGLAIFCKTLAFLRYLDFYKIPNTFQFGKMGQIDINDAVDFVRAETILKGRERP